MEFSGHIVYGVCFVIFGLGLYVTITSGNLVKKLFGLGMLQSSVMLFFIAIGYIKNGAAPIIAKSHVVYVNPLPQVLILTAIVVGLATLAVGLALCIQIKKKFGKIDESANYD